MTHLNKTWPRQVAFIILFIIIPCFTFAEYSVDEDPRETVLDPGDVFVPGPTCTVDDGDGGYPPGFPNLKVPTPQAFDLDAYSLEAPLEVCPFPSPPYIPGILFSFDDGDPGPGIAGSPDHATEIFFYDHCIVLHPSISYSYFTSITETFLTLGIDPPPTSLDDDVDAYETRPVDQDPWYLLYSPEAPPSDGGFGAGSEGNIYFVDSNPLSPPILWATPASLGVPDSDLCDIDGIATVYEEETPYVILFTTDANAPCGLDPGDIYISDNSGNYRLYADDVTDMKIAYDEEEMVDIDAIAINYYGDFEIDGTYEPYDPGFYKADWPNYAPNGMPDFSQDHLGWPLPPTYCGPTAVADSFWWFDSEMECDEDRTSGDSNETEPNDISANADNLGEVPPILGNLATTGDIDWYQFEIPYKLFRRCSVTVSTCAFRQPGDADTLISLYDGSSGSPGTLIAQDDDGCPPSTQSEIITAVDGGNRYFVKVESGPTGTIGNYTLSLGIDCYPLVRKYPDKPDDHSDHNVRPLIEHLSKCMNTDDVNGSGSLHKGTKINEMQDCIDNWLIAENLDDNFTEVTVFAPYFDQVEEEIEASEDVILLLGFYWHDGSNWVRCGGHYVTSAGVDSPGLKITLSDPKLNNAESGGVGSVLGPNHSNHAPTASPPPSHDDAQNLSHDRYNVGSSVLPPIPNISNWSIPDYATAGGATTCQDVLWWCYTGYEWGQNWPSDPPPYQTPCPTLGTPISTEVEAMVDVSPNQTPICIYFDSVVPWPDNLMIDKNPCAIVTPTAISYDVIRGKLCNVKLSILAPQVDLGYVQCLYDDVAIDHFDELSPDDTSCLGCWFYLIRQSTDPDYGNASAPGLEPRLPSSGGCP